jgi:hypothetical protein
LVFLVNTALEPTGFPNRTDTTIAFVNANRTFTISPVVSSFFVLQNGIKYTFNAPQTVVITDVEGMHYIYFDEGILKETTVFSDKYILDYVAVSQFYWDATSKNALGLADERHGVHMDGATHLYLHKVYGTAWGFGLSLSGIIKNGGGNLNAHAQFGVNQGRIIDEDIELDIPDWASTNGFPILYRTGSQGNWRVTFQNGFPVKTYGSGRPAYNSFINNEWGLTEVYNNYYVLCHVFATNNYEMNKNVVIMGQNQYQTSSTARTGAMVELHNLVTDGFPIKEFVALGTVIFETKNTYSNSVKSRIISTQSNADYVDWREATITPQQSLSSWHPDLSGRTYDDSHPATAISSTSLNSNLVSTDVQGAIDELSSRKIATVTTNTTLNKTNSVVLVNNSSTITITLPSGSAYEGKEYDIKKISSNNASVGITSASGITVDNYVTYYLTGVNKYIRLVYSSNKWHIIGGEL